jgi:hypothetical protein
MSLLLNLVPVGKEVALFTGLKYPELLIAQLALHNGDVASALRESFHAIDKLLEDEVAFLVVLFHFC